MYKLTETQYQVLMIAIDNAVKPEACSYAQGCVIGKLCDFYNIPYPQEDSISYNENNKAALNYPVELLAGIQYHWDTQNLSIPLQEHRQAVKDFVNSKVRIKETVQWVKSQI